jgi:hypothetical protein
MASTLYTNRPCHLSILFRGITLFIRPGQKFLKRWRETPLTIITQSTLMWGVILPRRRLCHSQHRVLCRRRVLPAHAASYRCAIASRSTRSPWTNSNPRRLPWNQRPKTKLNQNSSISCTPWMSTALDSLPYTTGSTARQSKIRLMRLMRARSSTKREITGQNTPNRKWRMV